MQVVLDACAIIAYLRNEKGADIVESLMINESCFVHALNMCEVYYDFLRAEGEVVAEEMLQDLRSTGITIREDMDSDLWKEAGLYKTMGRVSLADCFAMALTSRVNAELVTADHHEFDKFVNRVPFTIRFIR